MSSHAFIIHLLAAERSVRFGFAHLALLALSFSWCGCSSQPSDSPVTYPATGTVVDASGQPLSGGFVEFQSLEDQNLLAVGDIQSDGSFVLTTYVDGVVTTGAVLGEHRVTVHPPQIEHGGAEPFLLRPLQKIEATENVLSLKLPGR